MTYADASFVVALFVENDDHWPEAWRWWKNQRGPSLTVSRLTLFEAENTIRGMVVARKLSKAQAHSAIQGISRARLEGVLVRRNVLDHRLFPHAARLSQHHTVDANFGALDILHVAAALDLGADVFLTFDGQQRTLAKAEGLTVEP
jgi:predicted nucleic acid-binding protein